MGLDLFRIGVGLILFGLMFPLTEVFRKYASNGSATFMMFIWFVSVIIIFISAYIPETREVNKPSSVTR